MEVREILAFLRELRENNQREWFAGQKSRYLLLKEDFENWVEQLIARIVLWDEDVRNLNARDCIFRIYRDVRFSPDKRPYKEHFSAYICGFRGRKSERCGYYVHLQPGSCMLGAGCYCPSPALLKRIRRDIYENVEEFTSIIREPEFQAEFPEIDPDDKLKKVPAPFPADFPEADLLKYKHYDVITYKPDEWFESGELLSKVEAVFQKAYKFNRFLNYTIDNLP